MVEYEYPAHFEVLLVSQVNNIRWKARFVFVSSVLQGRRVGLEEVGDGLRAVFYGAQPLGCWTKGTIPSWTSKDPEDCDNL